MTTNKPKKELCPKDVSDYLVRVLTDIDDHSHESIETLLSRPDILDAIFEQPEIISSKNKKKQK